MIPEQEFLSAPVPAVYGPIEYREWKSQLERIHEVPRLSGGGGDVSAPVFGAAESGRAAGGG